MQMGDICRQIVLRAAADRLCQRHSRCAESNARTRHGSCETNLQGVGHCARKYVKESIFHLLGTSRTMLLLILLMIYTVAGLDSTQPRWGCPVQCDCDVWSTRGVFATCSSFDPSMKFDIEVAYLDLSNIHSEEGLVLTDRVFLNAGLQRVSAIKIANSSLKEIDMNAFRGLHNLNDLNLTGNHLALLKPDMLVNNTHLERLSLSGNPLQFMQKDHSPYHDYFLDVPSLHELDLSNCNLDHLLPTMFDRLTTLEYVNLASNNLQELRRDTLAPLVDLQELDLSNNDISKLDPDAFSNNSDLEVLHLKNNPLSSLVEVSDAALSKLDLSGCSFERIEENTFTWFPDLRTLNLSSNAISQIHPNAFSNLPKLQHLDLSNNDIKAAFPAELFLGNMELEVLKLSGNILMKEFPEHGFNGEFNGLYVVEASNCGLTHLGIDVFKNMQHLSRLNLSNNLLQYLEPGLLPVKLSVLDLSNNLITHLSQISIPVGSALRQFYLSANSIKKLQSTDLANARRLTKLDLSNCNLRSLQFSEELQLSSLEYLNVANNNISTIMVSGHRVLPRIQTLILHGNPLQCTDDLRHTITWLSEHGVGSSEGEEDKQLEELKYEPSNGSFNKEVSRSHLSWGLLLNSVCEEMPTQQSVEPLPKANVIEDTTLMYEQDVITEDDDDDEDDIDDSYDIKELSSDDNMKEYIWPIVIVGLFAFAIIVSLALLTALFLRWSRRRNSYQNKIARRHTTSPFRKPVYQQLTEDINAPITPVMMPKQQTYVFPDKQKIGSADVISAQSVKRDSYLRSSDHHSAIVPESV